MCALACMCVYARLCVCVLCTCGSLCVCVSVDTVYESIRCVRPPVTVRTINPCVFFRSHSPHFQQSRGTLASAADLQNQRRQASLRRRSEQRGGGGGGSHATPSLADMRPAAPEGRVVWCEDRTKSTPISPSNPRRWPGKATAWPGRFVCSY